MKKFDVIVIGAGSGLTISAYAAEQGLSVAVVEQGPFGGTCLNRGCIPSKMLIHSADVAETIKQSNLFGITAKITKIDWNKIVNRANKFVDGEARQIEQGNKQTKNITVYKTTAKFTGHKLLEVGKETITADKIFIAAGTRPSIPKIEGLDKVSFITSDEALRLKKQPKELIIIGGGYIAAELAHFFGSLGTNVTIVQRGPRLMSNEDEEIAQRFTEIAQQKYTILLETTTNKVYTKEKKIVVEVTTKQKTKKISGDALLIATGRAPNTDILNIQSTGVQLTNKGFVKVNEFLETNVTGIWAIGDIAGKYMFKHSANLEATYAVQNAFGKKMPVDYTAMPHAAFSSPQVAAVGKTEEQLIEEKTPYLKGVYDYKNTGYGKAIEDNNGFVKVLVHKKTKEILGCHIIGTHASILVHEIILAMKAKLTADDILNTIHIHPALPEVIQRAFWNLE